MKPSLTHTALAALLILAVTAVESAAQEASGLSSGLAMHGKSAYDDSDTHFSYANPDAPKGGTLKMAAIGTYDTLNPYSIKGKPAEGLSYVYDRLMARSWDEPFTMYPLIAERVEVATDRSAVTFYINPAARFHDGSPITSDDVIFSFETLRDHGRPNMRRIYRLVETVETAAKNAVTFKLGPDYDRETVMILALMPVLSKSFWQGRVFDQTIVAPPLLNGPYRIKAFEPGRFITYERVADYWAKDLLPNKGHFNFDEITYEYFRDDTIAMQAFQKGSLDLRREYDVAKWVQNYQNLSPDYTLEELPHQRPERVRSFIFNTRRAPFDDIRVRKALNLAFDDSWIGKNIFFGRYERIDSLFPGSALSGAGTLPENARALLAPHRESLSPEALEDSFSIMPATADMRERLMQADALLREAGWNIVGGKRLNDEGTPLSFEILIASPEDEKIAINFQKSLERLGIEMNVRTLDTASFQDRLRAYDFDMLSYFWQNTLSPGTEQVQYWSCEAAKQEARWNFPGLCEPAIESLAHDIAKTETYEDLKAHAQALDRAIMVQYPFIPLFYPKADFIARKNAIKIPANIPIYGSVLETWWMDRIQPTNRD